MRNGCHVMAAGRKRGRPVKLPPLDLGPEIRLANGTAMLGHRADPDAPNLPNMRAASAAVIYHKLWIHGALDDRQHEAADRYLMRLEQASGAKADMRGHGGGDRAGITETQLMALADLRRADAAIGCTRLVADMRNVIGWNLWPGDLALPDFSSALHRMADEWGM